MQDTTRSPLDRLYAAALTLAAGLDVDDQMADLAEPGDRSPAADALRAADRAAALTEYRAAFHALDAEMLR
ncbi:hypothetical protein GCM10025760_34250 [Microbacterium yannicii]|uniref:Uncharacterized protein n=1 Tax=Microbacterium yannicii TaxID=671622 RepID=A0ABP9MQ76_9MICO|nr:hypothetical protein [Microbacterium yannicii]MCO5951890.1 hypothetical protein [Microbacterium yannicii]